VRPDLCAQFLPADQFSWPFQQHSQQLKGLLLQWQAFAMLCQLAESRIGFENPKSQTLGWVVDRLHGKQIGASPVFRQPVARTRPLVDIVAQPLLLDSRARKLLPQLSQGEIRGDDSS